MQFSNRLAKEPAACGSPFGRREESLVSPALLVEVNEGLQVGRRIGGSVRGRPSPPSRPSDLASDLVTLFLVETAQVALEIEVGGQRQDRADVLRLVA